MGSKLSIVSFALFLAVSVISWLYTARATFPYPTPVPAKIWVVSFEYMHDIGSAGSEDPRLQNCLHSFPTYVITIHQFDVTDRQTDRLLAEAIPRSA